MTSKIKEAWNKNRFEFRWKIFLLSAAATPAVATIALFGDMAIPAIAMFSLMGIYGLREKINGIANSAIGELAGITIGVIINLPNHSLFRNDILSVYGAFAFSLLVVIALTISIPWADPENPEKSNG